jgi:hypothetical protein
MDLEMKGILEVLYAINEIYLTLGMLACMALAILLGSAAGRNRAERTSPEGKAQISALQASLLGLMALLLGFSLSLALGRYDSRSTAVVTEANAIGTAWLRTDLLSEPGRSAVRSALAEYVAIRAQTGSVTLAEVTTLAEKREEAEVAFARVWEIASGIVRAEPNPATVAMTNALNDMIDAFGTRDAELDRHVPEPVLYLLFLTLIFLGWMLGFAPRVAGERPPLTVVALIVLIVLLMLVIIDLDRPRRGIIEVDQTQMHALAASISEEMEGAE